jgi:4-amino-4-deoxy-L-arabinose transferase-like glycosyltransferase
MRPGKDRSRFLNLSTVNAPENNGRLPLRWFILSAALVLLLFAHSMMVAKGDSVNWDESQHLYSGWLSWKHADFGYNPEVPPLIKMWCAIPLLHRDIQQPAFQGRQFKNEGFALGQKFLAMNGIDRTLLPARFMASLLSVMLAILIFVAAREMFGTGAALFSLALFAFDPNFLAHESYVTTDIGAALTVLLSVYAFYRYIRRPAASRMLLLAVAVGLALTAKFTGVLVVPILALIAIAEIWRSHTERASSRITASALRMLIALCVASAFGFLCIWTIYGFRYQARPAGLELNPSTASYLQDLKSPLSRYAMTFAAQHHLLPEAYIYGLADTKISGDDYPSYFFGKMYPHAPHWYYPAALLIKSTIPFLLLLLLTIAIIVAQRWRAGREVIFLVIPPVVLFSIATLSVFGIGFRHLFSIFPLLYILIGGAAVYLASRGRNWRLVLGILLLWQIETVLAAGRGGWLAYANEAWGGPSHAHLYLSDSNTDWGQQLKAVKSYLDQHPGKPCYFAYFAQGPVDFTDYGIHCQQLPTSSGSWIGFAPMRFDSGPTVSGTIIVSGGNLDGVDRQGKLNPYEQFQTLKPTATIDNSVYIYDGTFTLPLAAALSHAEVAQGLISKKEYDEALKEAEIATQLAPESVDALTALGDALTGLGRVPEAKAAYTKAIQASQTIEPEFQAGGVGALQAKAAGQ